MVLLDESEPVGRKRPFAPAAEWTAGFDAELPFITASGDWRVFWVC
jgi:hypothetical protein